MMACKENISEKDRKQAGLDYMGLNHLISSLGNRTLRLLFRERYKILTQVEWENGSLTSNADFIKKQGSASTLTWEQKRALDSADINNWDFSLLIDILMSIGSEISKWNEVGQEASAEDEALKKLRYVRNYLNPVSAHDIQNTDYGWQWQVAKEALLRLGAREEDIECFRTNSKLNVLESDTAALDEENESKSKALQSRAEELIAAGEFGGGIQLYSEALLLTGLSIEEISCLYSGRSQAYINQKEEHVKTKDDAAIQIYVAIEDANRVIQLNPKCWKGYYLKGKCFQLQTRFKEAIDSFEAALSLEPESGASINAREACRLELADVGDILCTSCSRFGETQSREEVMQFIQAHELLIRSSDPAERARGCVFLGHRHLHGEGVPVDKKKAAELFQQAADAGNPEGAFNTGLGYIKGIGVKQNISEAVKFFEAAANQQMKESRNHAFDVLQKEAVAKSKAMLGVMYQHGIGKQRNYATAAKWFTRSAVEGFSTAARHVARMYTVGMGIPRDMKRGLQYFELAVQLGASVDNMHFLARQYATLGDLIRARKWHDQATASGQAVADSDIQHFENLLQHKQQEFEAFKKRLPARVLKSGVPIHILHERYFKRYRSDTFERMKLLEKVLPILEKITGVPEHHARSADFKTEELEINASQGQEYARILLDAIAHFHKGVEAIRMLIELDSVTDETSSSQKKMLKTVALAEVAACYTAEVGYVVDMSEECHDKLWGIALEFHNKGQRCVSDLHARVCILGFRMESKIDDGTLDFAKVCKALYPELPYFHLSHTKLLGLGFLGKPEVGLKVAEEGLKLFPDNAELLFYRADHLSALSEANLNSTLASGIHECRIHRDAYQEFIRKAPSGHARIPDVHYMIATQYALEGNFKDIEACYALGLEAEKKLLSNFLPYNSSMKEAVKRFRILIKGLNNDGCSPKLLGRLQEQYPEEFEENRKLKLTNPKRILVVRECRSRFARWDLMDPTLVALDTVMEAEHKQRAPHPQEIPSVDIDSSMGQGIKGAFLYLTIMEEYIDWHTDCILSVVKDGNDDFNLICFYNFDRTQPSTKKTLGFGSRIKLMNPNWATRLGVPVIRVDDPNSVILVSIGDESPTCRYCWKPNPPGLRCGKCKTAQYCNKECQKQDWKVLEHKKHCSVLCKHQDGLRSEINLESLKMC